MKERRPFRKAKYYLVTDREQVPWGNGEKDPGRGVKENLKPYVYKQIERDLKCDIVLFVERSSELLCMARLSIKEDMEPKRKRVWKGR